VGSKNHAYPGLQVLCENKYSDLYDTSGKVKKLRLPDCLLCPHLRSKKGPVEFAICPHSLGVKRLAFAGSDILITPKKRIFEIAYRKKGARKG